MNGYDIIVISPNGKRTEYESKRDFWRHSRYSLVSIDDNVFNFETIKDKNAEIPERCVEENEMRDMLAQFIDELPEREKKVIFLYYYEELTLKEISNIGII